MGDIVGGERGSVGRRRVRVLANVRPRRGRYIERRGKEGNERKERSAELNPTVQAALISPNAVWPCVRRVLGAQRLADLGR